MKKIHTLNIALILLGLTQTYAQLGNGWDSAFNFGGAGTEVSEMRYDSEGNLFFLAIVMGKAKFANTEIDPGGYGSFPYSEEIYGKISPDGAQTILKRIKANYKGELDANGNLMLILPGGQPTLPVNLGNGFINNTYGAKIVKINNTGVTEWMKPVNSGANVEYGNSGIALMNVQGMQFTPDGNFYAVVAGVNPASNPPTTLLKYPHRIIKFNPSGDEVWHTELFSEKQLEGLVTTNQFVDDNGNVTFGIYSTSNQWYYNGEAIATKMGKYSFGQSAYSIVIALNADGSNKFTVADLGTNATTTFAGINPINGNVYVNYSALAPAASTQLPFSTFPNSYGPPINATAYTFAGVLIYNSAGQFQNLLGTEAPKFLTISRTGNSFVSIRNMAQNEEYNKGGYVYNNADKFSVIEFLDQNFTFVKAIKAPRISVVTSYLGKVSMGGDFTTALTFGSKTLIASDNDPTFATRFPIFASVKADIFIAQADVSVTLPITLASFNASKINSGVKLTWITADEKNSSYFEVEKSTDGQLFTTLGRVNAAGNSSERKYYSLKDFIPANGANYYRLKQVDLDGKTNLSGPVSINFDLEADAKTIFYPNPAVNELHFTGLKANSTITLSNVDGKNILSQKISNNTLQIPATVKSGMYIMHIKTNEGNTTTLKVLVAK